MDIITRNMEREVDLFEPNMDLPNGQEKVSRVIKELDGLRMSLREAVERIQGVSSGTVEVIWRFSYIRLAANNYSFRVIRYRSERSL